MCNASYTLYMYNTCIIYCLPPFTCEVNLVYIMRVCVCDRESKGVATTLPVPCTHYLSISLATCTYMYLHMVFFFADLYHILNFQGIPIKLYALGSWKKKQVLGVALYVYFHPGSKFKVQFILARTRTVLLICAMNLSFSFVELLHHRCIYEEYEGQIYL